MSDHFFDTSALGKHYLNELGKSAVDGLHATSGSRHFISAPAKKVRVGHLTAVEFQTLTWRFRADVKDRRFAVVRLSASHFQTVERLVRRIGLDANLRTLDALQLAVALGLNKTVRPVRFVCADKALCSIATGEGLAVVNPEIP